jgi:hypothetical protein
MPNPRHTALILSRLEEVYDTGAIWRDILERWNEILDEIPDYSNTKKRPSLAIGDTDESFTIVWADTDSKDKWFFSIEEYANQNEAA